MKQMTKNDELHFKLGEMHSDIKSILIEAKRTNGRVTKLEADVNKTNTRLAKYIGGATVLIFLFNLVAPQLINKI